MMWAMWSTEERGRWEGGEGEGKKRKDIQKEDGEGDAYKETHRKGKDKEEEIH